MAEGWRCVSERIPPPPADGRFSHLRRLDSLVAVGRRVGESEVEDAQAEEAEADDGVAHDGALDRRKDW